MDRARLIEIQRKRFAFLKLVYEKSEGNENALIDDEEIASELGLLPDEAETIEQYLDGEGLLGDGTLGSICISHRGRLEVEAAIEKPDRPTEHFPANINILVVEHATNVQIQQGTHSSSQAGTFSSTTADYKQLDARHHLEHIARFDREMILADAEDQRQHATPRP